MTYKVAVQTATAGRYGVRELEALDAWRAVHAVSAEQHERVRGDCRTARHSQHV